ncbi:MAG: hypothetical protein ACFB5Z_03665 [Elainellaceae cyanobacterium]
MLNLPFLTSFRENNSCLWEDSVEAFVKVRNDITHPEKKTGMFSRIKSRTPNYIASCEESAKAGAELFQLGLLFVELALLKLCGYSGKYVNRLKIPGIEKVPWADKF